MKTPFFAVLITLSAALSHAQAPQAQPINAEQSRTRPVVMERAEQWTMRSKAGRMFEISIARPSAAAPARGYPVMYVLDLSTAFATLADTLRNQEQMFGPVVILSEVAGFKAVQQRTKVHRRLLITVGELEAVASPEEIRLGAALKISDPMKLMRDAKQVGNSAELAADLASLASSGLEVRRVAFPDETHNSVIPAYLARGARFTLNGWFQ